MSTDKFAGHTPGPWRWEYCADEKVLKMCGGFKRYDETVFNFARVGLSGAGPLLRHNGDMRRFCDIDAATPAPGREHHKRWFQLVTHPDLLLMAAAPELLAENERLNARINSLGDELEMMAYKWGDAEKDNETLRNRVAELEELATDAYLAGSAGL